ncbi:hypothetical protein K437DRAFT_259477 [Tilletiaria anomala UBC 951]|uniref:DNA replication complex GINS protein PSF3 n=1 Tax=Tilletiaria anomala (strain ATCC 24038 / CBS 436.72 / UBC 951) TaxID=1037660 RepID=A0A066VDB3_TILAU|nr:uncharacterized protein K437DRAFT_259477 [Tilletiaria anomala UBC 951]KDN38278.1 hypothetical protein K437DRAFT_259477 [Tilletiaria anomala UBC 951]
MADSQRVPCTFNLCVPGLGHLSGGNEHDLKEGTRLELPFWFAEMMVMHDLVTMQLPKPYAQRVKAALDAEATSVNLRNLCNWWYALGLRIDSLSNNLAESLSKTYLARLARVYSSAQHLSSASLSVFGESNFSGGVSSGGGGGSGDGPAGGGGGGALEKLGIGRAAIATAGTGANGSGGGSGGGGSMSAEMSEFLHGLDESEKLLLRDANISNNISRAYLAGRR